MNWNWLLFGVALIAMVAASVRGEPTWGVLCSIPFIVIEAVTHWSEGSLQTWLLRVGGGVAIAVAVFLAIWIPLSFLPNTNFGMDRVIRFLSSLAVTPFLTLGLLFVVTRYQMPRPGAGETFRGWLCSVVLAEVFCGVAGLLGWV